MSTRAYFTKNSQSRQFLKVPMAEGQVVRLRSLTFSERRGIYRRWMDDDGKPTREDIEVAQQALFCVMSIVDDKGNPEYTDCEADLALFINSQSPDMQKLDVGIKFLNFGDTEALRKNLRLEATPAS